MFSYNFPPKTVQDRRNKRIHIFEDLSYPGKKSELDIELGYWGIYSTLWAQPYIEIKPSLLVS